MTTQPTLATFQSAQKDTRFQSHEDQVAPDGATETDGQASSNIDLEIEAKRSSPRGSGVPVITPIWSLARQMGYASIFYGLRLRGQFPSRLLASPSDIWPGDPAIGALMPEGLFRHQGAETSGDIPDFTDPDLPLSLKTWLHSFVWLRDLATLDDIRKARAIAEPALKEWLVHYSRWDKTAWAPHVVGLRLMALINHAPLVLASKDLVYRSKVLNALAHQGRHLSRTLDMAEPGLPRIQAACGLMFSSILLPGGEARTKPGLRMLERELDQVLLADGTPESRNPEDLVEILQLLITLRDGYRAARKTPPTILQVTIDKAAAALRGIRLKGYGLAAFNGARHGQNRRIQHCIDMSESQASAQLSARQGGYQRLEGGQSAVVMDTGLAPRGTLSAKAHAGALAFEFAHGGAALVVNCGAVSADMDCGVPADALRATAAHSAPVINNTNVARLKENGEIGKTAKRLATGRTNDADGQAVRSLCDAYAQRYNYTIERTLWLSSDGRTLAGNDHLKTANGKAPRSKKDRELDVRFHLHPDVTCTETQDGALLRLKDGTWWQFRAQGATVALEPSLYVTVESARAVPTQQIVLNVPLEDAQHSINWSFQEGKSTSDS